MVKRRRSLAEKPVDRVAVEPDSAWIAAVRGRLGDWYADAGRELPWRASRDAYRILVSEMMLVQTTVVAVIPFFERFIARFPDVAALAAADEAEVVKAWEGLGYYRRARQLHQAAKRIVSEHAGTIPNDPAAVRALPGVGRYIAGAILSFAFDQPEPIVEANTQRVLRACSQCATISSSRRPANGSGRPPCAWCRRKMRVLSTRRSWTWGPWSARPESLAAWSARSLRSAGLASLACRIACRPRPPSRLPSRSPRRLSFCCVRDGS